MRMECQLAAVLLFAITRRLHMYCIFVHVRVKTYNHQLYSKLANEKKKKLMSTVQLEFH